jgi:hypothetical protein
MKRTMARQAEADRERRARIITADGELQASKKLAQAADVMSDSPAALQLRLLQTMVEVASEKSSTVILPFPVELLRFLEHSSLPHAEKVSLAREARSAAREKKRSETEPEQLSPQDEVRELAPAEDVTADLASANEVAAAVGPVPEIPEVDLDAVTEADLEAEFGTAAQNGGRAATDAPEAGNARGAEKAQSAEKAKGTGGEENADEAQGAKKAEQ